ncbi:peptide chain release factor aRF-1 [Natronobacterium gregoryi]|uniref:Peptide chain release factor subunit 1 n=2 Tax=Natronobacterium gregoryi TaxID=44930 RepID=L0AJ54_NATGS|nr:peptide chain release factor aRF-1 [Natronobacterium gregoryi]AFZ73187.1 peptide chain release factor 1 [Natronobacterium gregoryi SP2]ELY71356.1 peptide chain release factor 1 [Natronobacterium gregoryi SP2]PLK21597.1 peptide chain release factor 1 [Natronobacterium gregoryi SP2]SFI59092.1 peptide chain release factor subunit 1 (aeRF-1) [Natronobacterium gregoryi]
MSQEGEQEQSDRKKYEFRKVIEDLKNYDGSGTQLVSIYVPEDRQISDVVQHVTQEHSEAANIKSKQTRTAVQDALTSIKDRLRYYDTYPPENGIVLFSGAVDSGGGRTEMVTNVLESPPQPIESFRYHCDSDFLTEPLEEMMADKGLYGLIVLDRRESNVGWLKGKRVEPVKSASSLVPGKQRKGGQSAQRFARLRLEAIDNFYQEVAGMANDLFVPKRHELDGILVGGPSPTKDEFLDGDYLHHELQDEVIGKFDVAYTDESGLDDLVDNAEDALADAEVMKDKKQMEEFFEELNAGDLATYGFEQTRQNLVMGSVDRLLISEDLRKDVVVFDCGECGNTDYEVIDRRKSTPAHTCSDCDSAVEATDEDREDAIDHLIGIAEQRGTETKFISTDFEKGDQLYNAFGGFAGILRYSTGV